jgi:tetratricopeptide (TPR) repeat protein
MHAGDDWWLQIEDQIRSATAFVLILTPAIFDSPVVRREWAYARRTGTSILPVTDSGPVIRSAPRWLRKADLIDLGSENPDQAANWERFLRQARDPPPRRPIPFMAEPLPAHFVPRERVKDVAAHFLDKADGNPRNAKVILYGPAGFGKTTLAQSVCHDTEVIEAFTGGILWASIGPRGKGTLRAIKGVLGQLEPGESFPFQTPCQGASYLEKALEQRDCLIAFDDVWNEADIAPFLGASHCGYLITTRSLENCALGSAVPESVQELSINEATELLITLLPAEMPRNAIVSDTLAQLAERLGQWPILLKICGATLGREVRRGKPFPDALDWIYAGLKKQGLQAFDRANPRDRNQALAKSVAVSLRAYDKQQCHRLLELAIFPPGETIPERVVARLWHATASMDSFAAGKLLREFAGAFFEFSFQRELDDHVLRFHDTLHEYLAAQLTSCERAKTHDLFLRSYKSDEQTWASVSDDQYLYDHLAGHLAAAGRTHELHDLLGASWMSAQQSRVGSHIAFLADATVAMEHAANRKPPDLPEMLRASLICGTLISHATNVTPEILGVFARVGQGVRASGWASMIADPEKRHEAFRRISEGHLERGEQEQALISAKSALTSIPLMEDFHQAAAYASLAPIAARVVMLDVLRRQIGDRAADSYYGKEACPKAAIRLAEAGLYDHARQFAEDIAHDFTKAETLIEVADALIHRGDANDAVAAASRAIQIADSMVEQQNYNGLDVRASAWAIRVRALAAAGEMLTAAEDIDQARSLADIGDRKRRVRNLSWIVPVLARLGHLDEAREHLERLRDLSGRIDTPGQFDFLASVLPPLAVELARAGMQGEAESIAQSVWLDKFKTEARVAAVLPAAESEELAERLITRAAQVREDRYTSRNRILEEIANEFLHAQHFKAARRAVSQIALPARTALECRLALEMARAGRETEAKELAASAVAVALAPAAHLAFRELDQILILSQAALALSAAGNRDTAASYGRQALTIPADQHAWSSLLPSLDDPWTKIAENLCGAGLMDYATEAVGRAFAQFERARPDHDKSLALRAMAGSLARAHVFDRALTVADAIPYSEFADESHESKVCALAEIAAALAACGFTERASECANRAVESAARAVDLPYSRNSRDKTICAVGEILRNGHLFDSALAAVAGVKNLEQKAGTLKMLIQDAWLNELWGPELQAGTPIHVSQLRQTQDALVAQIEAHFDLAVMARALAKLGSATTPDEMRDQASSLASRAVELASSKTDDQSAAILLSDVAAEFGADSTFAKTAALQAIFLASALELPYNIDVSAKVATTLANAGLCDQALIAIDPFEFDYGNAMLSVARALLAKGRIDEACKLARKIGPLEARKLFDEANKRECTRLLVFGHVERALECAGAIEDDDGLRAAAHIEIARAFDKRGDRNAALELAAQALSTLSTKTWLADESVIDSLAQTLVQCDVTVGTLIADARRWATKYQAPFCSAAAVSLWRAGRNEDALPMLAEAFQIASRLGRAEIWEVLRTTTGAVTDIDGGETVWSLYEAVRSLESWLPGESGS